MTNLEKRQLNFKCRVFGQMFQRAVHYGNYNIRKFVKQLMTDKVYEDLLMIDERFEWADECVLLSYLENTKSFNKCKGIVEEFDDYELKFIGHLYKYWMRTRNTKPSEVYKLLPFDKFHNNFGFYHTQGEEFIINDVIKEVEK